MRVSRLTISYIVSHLKQTTFNRLYGLPCNSRLRRQRASTHEASPQGTEASVSGESPPFHTSKLDEEKKVSLKIFEEQLNYLLIDWVLVCMVAFRLPFDFSQSPAWGDTH